MRVLFTNAPPDGHFYPLIPFAQAMRDEGHEVAFASHPQHAAAVERLGLRHFPAGLTRPLADVFPQLRPGAASDLPPVTGRDMFGIMWPRHMVPDLLALTEDWPPDLIVRGALEYGGCVAAEVLGIPHAAIAVNANADFLGPTQLVEPLGLLRDAHGLTPDPALTMLERYLTLRPFPPRFRDPARPVGPTTHHLRPPLGDRTGAENLPPWVATLPDRPVVYVGLGTVFNQPAIFRAFLAGLCDEPLTLVVTVGRDQDPADYGQQPDNVHIERYIPLSLLLPHCDVAVTNGGSGTLTAALAHGLPVVVVPTDADHPANAARCMALGLGLVIPATEVTAESARQAVLAVLADPTYRQNAELLRDEIAALPGPEYAVELLERLARDKEPILAG